MLKGCPSPKGPRKPVLCDFPPLRVRSAKTQTVEKVAQFLGETFGADGVFPQKCPYVREIAFFPFWPGISLSAKGPRPTGPRKPVFCDFLPLGVRSAKTQNVKKLRNFGVKLLGRTDFFPKSAPSTRKLCFSVFGPEFL